MGEKTEGEQRMLGTKCSNPKPTSRSNSRISAPVLGWFVKPEEGQQVSADIKLKRKSQRTPTALNDLQSESERKMNYAQQMIHC